jgi:membrane protein implicated in regulation of membrane protease activity
VPLFRFLVAWANVPFAVAAGVAAVFALLQVTGVLGLIAGGGEGDHDVDADVDHDVNMDAGADVDHDVDADHDVDQDTDHDADHDADDHGPGARDVHGRSLALAALAPFGLGKIPLSVMWQTFCIAFALAGFALNARYLGSEDGVPPVHSLAWTMPLSLLAGALCVAGVARLLGPVLSSKEQEATSRAQLVGQIGVVISSRVDRDFGEVRIRDKTGHDIRVVCKLAEGAKRAPTERQNVVVVDYEAERGELLVEPLEEGELGETGTSGR